ncbi:hypothetical protein AYI69_g9339 [Smittium culicis]|uniref:Uncharacterized protein n=1 Tax=Smittium culicis TaxID=133412 RepID=A0A1R1XDC3_9FUNG|nr:hypothetical protein AYI69_g9339 [Smittium culicis]
MILLASIRSRLCIGSSTASCFNAFCLNDLVHNIMLADKELAVDFVYSTLEHHILPKTRPTASSQGDSSRNIDVDLLQSLADIIRTNHVSAARIDSTTIRLLRYATSDDQNYNHDIIDYISKKYLVLL